jgi:protein gp37
MVQDSKIEWTKHTMNPWRGCTKISPGCTNCYADTLSHRNPKTLGVWGPKGTRVVASEVTWREPIKWDKIAEMQGERHRVFCASLADVFEQWDGPMQTSNNIQWWKRADGTWTTSDHYRDTVMLTMQDVRARLFALIEATPNLDWLLLTKRPENVLTMTYDAWCKPVPGHVSQNEGDGRHWHWPANVWLGTSVESQQYANERIPHLLRTPAAVRFLSCEPLLSAVDLFSAVRGPCHDCGHPLEGHALNSRIVGCQAGNGTDTNPLCGCRVVLRDLIHWVIVGGESGAGARPFELDWARSIQNQCYVAGVPWFMKQAGAEPRDWTRGDPPNHEPPEVVKLRLLDKKGGDLAELPAALRVREFPTVPR